MVPPRLEFAFSSGLLGGGSGAITAGVALDETLWRRHYRGSARGRKRARRLTATSRTLDNLSELLGSSPQVSAVRDQTRRLLRVWSKSRRPPPVLIQGETGTGKGLLARALHPASPRARGAFVDVNCAAIPETLLEAELFGYERGAFTDARQPKPGLFQVAHRGTLFLDEIGLLPLALQAKLLSALEERAVRRLGGTRLEPADVWVIAATNENLKVAIRERRFREDLYHRLALVTIVLPPLRSRGDDVITLAEHFLLGACAEYGLAPKALADDARAAIRAYPWPGNVRELANSMERAALLVDAPALRAADLALVPPPAADEGESDPALPADLPASSRDLLRSHLDRVLTETNWNITRTAAILGVSRNTVAARIERFGLKGPRKAGRATAREGRMGATQSRPEARPTHWEARRLTFLRIAVPRDPEALDASSSPALEAARDKLRAFGGRLEGVGRHAVLATFGIDSREEHAVLAAHAALAIHHAVRELPRSAATAAVRIGVHTAEVLVHLAGNAAVIDAEESRLAWNTLDSAMGTAPANAIAVTSASAELIRRRFTLVPCGGDGTHLVSGLWRTDSGAATPRGIFAGRREELALIESRYATVVQGRGQVLAIAGDAGIGKSRLVLELVASRRLGGVQYFEGRCLPGEVQAPLAPMLQLAAAAARIEESDLADVIERKLADTLADSDGDVHEMVSALLYGLVAKAMPPEAPGAPLRRRLLEAIRGILLARGRTGPVVVVVEDLQWVDPSTEACLDGIVEAVASAPILLATTYRTGYRPRWVGAPHVLQLTLPPLSAPDSLAIIRGILEPSLRSAELEQRIQGWAEGNPLFIEELSRRALERGDGSLGPDIPATIEDTIDGRLARLPARLRRLLSAASVIGRDVPFVLLQNVLELGKDIVASGIAQLDRADFVHASPFDAGGSRCTFKHAIVQETVYKKLAKSECRALHARVLDAMEALYGDKAMDQVERLAHHALLSAAHDRAIPYLLRAGRKAAGRFALKEAIAYLEKGLACLSHLPPGLERNRHELGLLVTLGMVQAATRGSGSPEAASAFSRALVLHEAVADFPQRRTLFIGHWFSCILRAQYAEARRVAEQLLALGEREADLILETLAHQSLGITALYCGEFADARIHLEQAASLYDPEEHHTRVVAEYGWPIHVNPRVHSLAYLARALWCLGYPDQALVRARASVAQAEKWGGALNVATALGLLAITHELRREPNAVVEVGEQATAHAAKWGIGFWAAIGSVLTSVARSRSATNTSAEESRVQLERSIGVYRATGTTLGLTWFLTLFAESCRLAGRIADGIASIDEALGLAATTGERYHEPEIELVRSRLLLDAVPANPGGAERCLRRGLDLARAQHAKGWELRIAIELARLLRTCDRADEARDLLQPIHAWFTEGFDTADLVEARALLEMLPAS